MLRGVSQGEAKRNACARQLPWLRATVSTAPDTTDYIFGFNKFTKTAWRSCTNTPHSVRKPCARMEEGRGAAKTDPMLAVWSQAWSTCAHVVLRLRLCL